MSGKMNKALLYAGLFLLVMLLLAGPALAVAPAFGEGSDTVLLRGRIISVENMDPEDEVRDFVQMEQLAIVEITTGEYRGETFTILNALMGHPLFDQIGRASWRARVYI